MTPLYESRQVGWFIIGMTLVMMIFLVVVSTMSSESDVPIWLYPFILLSLLPFSVMKVTVTREHLRVSFLLSLPRKTIRIGDIQSCETYHATGLQRFQTQVKPFQGRFQLTGAGGVVVHRIKGIPITISDPEPEKLARAVARAQGKHAKHGKA